MNSLVTLVYYSRKVRNLSRNSDEVLLNLIGHDDEQAFEELFDRYWEKAHAVACAKLGSSELAQEIVHDLFISFWQRRHSLQIENFAHYLQVSMKYKIITYLNQELARRRQLEEWSPQFATTEGETSKAVEYSDLLNALEDKMKWLPEKTQEVFRLNRLEGRSVSEIARLLNLSEKAIEYHITRSRKELKVLLKDFIILIAVTNVHMFLS